jgi:hypothetical protein
MCALNDVVETEPVAKQSTYLDVRRHTKQRWYQDSGASNHMTSNKEAFTELDAGIP